MLDLIMLGLGFAGGFVYFAAHSSITHGWISGTDYLFHGGTVVSCTMVASSSIYSEHGPQLSSMWYSSLRSPYSWRKKPSPTRTLFQRLSSTLQSRRFSQTMRQ